MTERLYYADSYCTTFSAHVIERLTWEGQSAVVLDRTAFYPASGGQPADRGELSGAAVLDVVAREEDGAVVHILAAPLSPPRRGRGRGAPSVKGQIDWPRRFDHMQQHTGQHILSAAFERTLDADTVGFHLGVEASTIDLNVARLDPRVVTQVEELANRVVWEDRPVSARFVGSDELAALPLRRSPTVEGAVRIVDIGPSVLWPFDRASAGRRGEPVEPSAWQFGAGQAQGGTGSGQRFDVNPCGGTHVARTGEIGLIKIVRLDYRGSQTRVEFLCGGRALRDYRAKDAVIGQLAAALTVGYWELEQAVERLRGEAKQLRQDLRQARKQLLKAEVAELAEAAAPYDLVRVVWRVWERREPEELRALAQELAQRSGMAALLASVGERVHFCFACAEGVNMDMRALLRQACERLGGKGGGQSHLAQGSAPATDVARVEAVLADLVSHLPPDPYSPISNP